MKQKAAKIFVLVFTLLLISAGMLAAAAANAQSYMDYGVKALQAKQYDNAIKYLSSSVQMQPNSQAYYYLGLSYMGKGNKANALSSFQQAMKLNPNNTAAKQMAAKLGGGAGASGGQGEAYLVKGHQYLKAKQYDAAIKLYRASASAQPTYQAYQFMGTAYFYKGDKANAKLAYEKSLQLNPNNPGVRSMLAKLGGAGGDGQSLGEPLGVHPLLLTGIFAGVLVLALVW